MPTFKADEIVEVWSGAWSASGGSPQPGDRWDSARVSYVNPNGDPHVIRVDSDGMALGSGLYVPPAFVRKA